MTTLTTKYRIPKAVGGDNARDYLKTNLAAGLDIIDAHDHGLGGIYVKDAPYNAVGNGSANDTSALQAAIDANAARGGGAIDLGIGRYKVLSQISLTPPAADLLPLPYTRRGTVWLRGAGRGVTSIECADLANLIAGAAKNTNIIISDLSLINTATPGTGNGLYLADTYGFILRNVGIYRFACGILLEAGASSDASIRSTVSEFTIDHVEIGGGTVAAGAIGMRMFCNRKSGTNYSVSGGIINVNIKDAAVAVQLDGATTGGGTAAVARNEFLILTGEGCERMWKSDGMGANAVSQDNIVYKLHSDDPVGDQVGFTTGAESIGNSFHYLDSIRSLNQEITGWRDRYNYEGEPQGWFDGTSGFVLPSGTGSGHKVRNDTMQRIQVSMPNTAAGIHIVTTNGNDIALQTDVFLIDLEVGEQIYFATTVPASWYWRRR